MFREVGTGPPARIRDIDSYTGICRRVEVACTAAVRTGGHGEYRDCQGVGTTQPRVPPREAGCFMGALRQRDWSTAKTVAVVFAIVFILPLYSIQARAIISVAATAALVWLFFDPDGGFFTAGIGVLVCLPLIESLMRIGLAIVATAGVEPPRWYLDGVRSAIGRISLVLGAIALLLVLIDVVVRAALRWGRTHHGPFGGDVLIALSRRSALFSMITWLVAYWLTVLCLILIPSLLVVFMASFMQLSLLPLTIGFLLVGGCYFILGKAILRTATKDRWRLVRERMQDISTSSAGTDT